jgi:FGGY-family pentulose kinase
MNEYKYEGLKYRYNFFYLHFRSICSVACKWNFDALKGSWSVDFLNKIGLADLAENNFAKIGSTINFPADPIGHGLTEKAAMELNLLPNTAVGTSMIDAHAGALALLGCDAQSDTDLTSKLAIICGTSSCHMSLTNTPIWAQGIWGPYKHALLPNMYLNEAGQSATGILLDYILRTHPCYHGLREKFGQDNLIYNHLNGLVDAMAATLKLESFHQLTEKLHVWPDFHGNRSPIADPNLQGMVKCLER